MEEKLTLKVHVEDDRCMDTCPFLMIVLPGGYECRLFGRLNTGQEMGPECLSLIGGRYPRRHDNCFEMTESD